jgi:hypothetical protein
MSTENSNVKSMAVVAAQAAVTALSFSAFSSAIGTLMASTPMAELPSKSKATKTGLQDLRAQFGNELVDRALRAAGPNDDILSIAEAVDAAFQESLHARFTDFEVNTALNACPPGDMRCVWEVAQALHSKGVKPTTVPEKTQVIAAVAAEVSIKKRSKNAGPQIGKQTIDTRTGLVYKSLAQAVKQTNGFAEYGVNPKVSFGEFKVQRLSGGKTGRYQALAYYDLTHPK